MPRIVWPFGLTCLRLALGPVMLLLAQRGAGAGPWLVVCLFIAVASDIADGILARHLGVATPALRRFDSLTDLAFWLCALGSVWIRNPELVRKNAIYLGAMLLLEAFTYSLSFWKFGREHSTHAYSAKAWGLVLVAAFTAILRFGEHRLAIPILFATYLISFIDVVAIICLLPRWQSDVPSCYHAWLARREIPFQRHKLFH